MDAPFSASVFLFKGFRLDRLSGALYRRDERAVFAPVAIGSRALDVLGVLVERPGDLVSRAEIMSAVWPETVVEESNLNVHIAALRRVLDKGRADGNCIQTIPGRGYRFVVPVIRADFPAPLASGRGNGVEGPVDEPSERGYPPAPDAPLVVPISQPSVAPRLSIVVLPFANLSNDPEQESFAYGITEDLTSDLSRLENMFVVSRNTAFTYRNKPIDTKQIGRDLAVRYVLEGSVRRTGNQVRVNAQLIDAETDGHLWAERFDGNTSDLFALQDEITARIGNTLNIELTAAEAARPTERPAALDYVLRGRAARHRPNSPGVYAEAIGLFEHALALDPQSVEAQSRLAGALVNRVLDQMTNSATADLERAEALVDQALAANPRSGYVHQVKGDLLRAQNRWREAIPEYETAVALNRNSLQALNGLAQCKLLAGSLEEVIPLEEEIIRLSPRDPAIGFRYMVIGSVHLLESRIDEAIIWLEKARSAAPAASPVRSRLAAAYALKGKTDPATVELAEARRLSGGMYSSIASVKAQGRWWGVPKVRALYEATYFTGLRLAGMPEE